MTEGTASARYGWVAIAFHWLIAVAIGGAFWVGWDMTDLPLGPEKFREYALHKSIGVTILTLAILRLAWRLGNRPPPLVDTMSPLERRLAELAHLGLYALILLIPLTGFAYNLLAGFPLAWFGVPLLSALPEAPGWKDAAQWAHYLLGWALLGVIALHVLAALRHHFLLRDRTLWRMLPILPPPRRTTPILALAGLLLAGTAQAANWKVDPAASKLGFRGTLEGAPFDGAFKRFEPSIDFDPADLAAAKVKVSIDIASIGTGAADRDRELPKPEWFDLAHFPKAEFAAEHFERTGPDAYTAAGTLTIRDKAVPVTLPFTLRITGDDAVMDGSVAIDRTQFGIGQGQWAAGDVVGKQVTVTVHLVANKG
jgi:cytochrome b561